MSDAVLDPLPDPVGTPLGAPSRRHPAHPPWWRSGTFWWVVAMVASFAVGMAANLVHVPYAIMSPGPVVDVLGQATVEGRGVPRIEIQGAPTYPTTGSLDFTTIELIGGPGYPVTPSDVLRAWLDPNKDVYPVESLFPPQATQAQVAEEGRAEMSASQKEAAVVALRALGKQVPETVVIAKLVDGSPSAGVLQAGDVLVSIAGKPATDTAAVRAAIQATPAGRTVEVMVTRGGQPLTLTPTTGSAPDGSGRTVLGIVLQRDYVLPFPVTVDATGVGGPSAGLMFSLGIYDKLTEGPMTGGRAIAGTGTIDSTGKVGPIGGIPQKLAGARAAGAQFFLAPADNCPELVGREPNGLTVVRVATFDEARHAVEEIAADRGAQLPRCTPPAK